MIEMKMTKRKQISLLMFSLVLAIPVLFVLTTRPAVADAYPQVYYLTPTPDERGRVIYIVKSGDTCTSISLKNNISEEDIRLLNDISDEQCTVVEGQELLLAIVEQPTDLPITPTPTSLFPTPTPFTGYVTVCIRLYEDVNGDAVHEENEILLADGAASITDTLGKQTWTGLTKYDEGLCFEDLPVGEYNVSIAIPAGYNSTTFSNQKIIVNAGDTVMVNFGAQPGSAGAVENTEDVPSGNGKSPLMAVIGALMLLTGGGLGLYMFFSSRRSDRF